MNVSNLKAKAKAGIDQVVYNWSEPPKGRYMNFKEIFAYSFGGIGAYFIICMGNNLIVGSTNMIVGAGIGVAAMDMYYIYLIATIIDIPLTAVRAQMIDNTRSKAGKYRPYLLSMGFPTVLIVILYVWFPYEKLDLVFTGTIFGKEKSYAATWVIILIFNILLKFFFNFFNEAYTNLIHVLSPNTQERTDVLAIKSVVYSLAPSIMSFVVPIVAQVAANDNMYNIKVYRICYPIFAIIGIAITVLIYGNTKEKIVQAKTHTIQISFMDSIKAVAKNKYFWIISLAGWIGFLESAYSNILSWSYTYGHTCNGTVYAILQTVIGNASLWGMIASPFCIRKFGKRGTLIMANILNIIFIAFMLFNLNSIGWLAFCVYLYCLSDSFLIITAPAIQADIRDYQQYKTGERIDGMFGTVSTIGSILALATSSVLPSVQSHYGIVEGNGYASPYDILDVTTGQPGLLYTLMKVLVLMAILGATLNVIPYFFYDFTEKKQKCVIRVLQVRAMFEDYGNNALGNRQLVEAIDTVNNAREMAGAEPKEISKDTYKSIKDDKPARKAAKKEYKEAVKFNEEIEVSKFVCEELDKFDSPLYKYELEIYTKIHDDGLKFIEDVNIKETKKKRKDARSMPKTTKDEKDLRRFEINLASMMISAKKHYDKYYGTANEFVSPDMDKLTNLFDQMDELDAKIFELNKDARVAAKTDEKEKEAEIKAESKKLSAENKKLRKQSEKLRDEFAKFNRAAKPYNEAVKILTQYNNYCNFDEIAALYDEAKEKAEAEEKEKDEEMAAKRAEQEAELQRRKEEKKAAKEMKKRMK